MDLTNILLKSLLKTCLQNKQLLQELEKICVGGPQGSIFGPLLYNSVHKECISISTRF